MFLDYYRLREHPFGVTPDSRFLYLTPTHREALASLVYGIETGRGFLGFIAKPGMGKTTLLFQVLEKLRTSARTVFLFQTQGSWLHFFRYLLGDLGVDTRDLNVYQMHKHLNEILINEARLGRRFVLLVDEAQNLGGAALEMMRMLSNFETPQTKLIQIVLAGQPQLAEKLASPSLVQLRQRIAVLARLHPLSPAEVESYVLHRLRVAGYQGGPLFTPGAVSVIAKHSEGIPRNVNNLCFAALSLGYAKGQKTIDAGILQEVVADFALDPVTAELRPSTALAPSAPRAVQVSSTDPPPANATSPAAVRNLEWAPSFRFVTSKAGAGRCGILAAPLVVGASVAWLLLRSLSPSQVAAVKPAAGDQAAVRKSASHDQTATSRTPQASLGLGRAPNPALSVPATKPSSDSSAPSQKLRASEMAPPPRAASALPPTRPRFADSNSTHKSASNYTSGVLIVTSNIKGARISIDGRAEADWVTPHVFSLPAHNYRIAVSKEGYKTWLQEVRVENGLKELVNMQLLPLTTEATRPSTFVAPPVSIKDQAASLPAKPLESLAQRPTSPPRPSRRASFEGAADNRETKAWQGETKQPPVHQRTWVHRVLNAFGLRRSTPERSEAQNSAREKHE